MTNFEVKVQLNKLEWTSTHHILVKVITMMVSFLKIVNSKSLTESSHQIRSKELVPVY